MPPANKDPAAGDYADYYKRIREMAKDKGTKEEDVLFLLRERQKGEAAYKNVSCTQILYLDDFACLALIVAFFQNFVDQLNLLEFIRSEIF